MKIEGFKSGKYLQQRDHKTFSPANINHQWIWDDVKINTRMHLNNIKIIKN